MESRNGIMATTMMMAAAAAPVPVPPATMEYVLLSRIVEADAATMEANGLLAAGIIGHDRYEAAARDRDDAIDAACAFLNR